MVLISRKKLASLNETWKTIGTLRQENCEMELLKALYPTIKQAADAINYDYASCVMDLKEVEDFFRTLDREYYDNHFSRFILGTCRSIKEQLDELQQTREVEFSHLEHFVQMSTILKDRLIHRTAHLNKEIKEKELVLALFKSNVNYTQENVDDSCLCRYEKQNKVIIPMAIAIDHRGHKVYLSLSSYMDLKNDRWVILKFEQGRNTILRQADWKSQVAKANQCITTTERHMDETQAFQDALHTVEKYVFHVGSLRKALPEAIEMIDQPGERAILAATSEVETILSMKAHHAARFQCMLSEWELLKVSTGRLEGLEQAIAKLSRLS